MSKAKTIGVITVVIAALGWLFRHDLGLGVQEYKVETIAVPPSSYSAVAQGKIDIDGGIIEISARQDGTYREVLVGEGDIVYQGQVLAIQEDDEERIDLKSSEASLLSVRAQMKALKLDRTIKLRERDRLKPLVEMDAASVLDLDRAEDEIKSLDIEIEKQKAAILQAEANIESARFRLEQRTIRAPRPGRIIEVKARPGMGASTLNVSTAFTLMPNAQKIVRADLDQEFVGKVKVGQKATISADSGPSESFQGTVIRVGEIFGRKSSSASESKSSTANDFVIEVVVGAGEIPLLIGQRVLVRFDKEATSPDAG